VFNDNCCNNLKSGDDLAGLLGNTPLSRDTTSIHNITNTNSVIYEFNKERRLVKILVEEASDKVYLKIGGDISITIANASFFVYKNNFITIDNSQSILSLRAICATGQTAILRVATATYDPSGDLE
jgi:hypothetical protein